MNNSIHNSIKRIKYFRINLTNTVQDLKSENYVFAKSNRNLKSYFMSVDQSPHLKEILFYLINSSNSILIKIQVSLILSSQEID